MPQSLDCESTDSQTIAPWVKSNAGERRLGDLLDRTLPAGARLLHHRMLPNRAGRLDHIVVAATGVWIIDVNYTKRKIERTDIGTRRRPEPKLYVGGRDRTNLARMMSRHSDGVETLVRTADANGVPFHRVLCFTDASWRWFARPFMIEDVLVTTPKRLLPSICDHGPLDHRAITVVTAELERALPHA